MFDGKPSQFGSGIADSFSGGAKKLLNHIPSRNYDKHRTYELTGLYFRERVGYNQMHYSPMATDFSCQNTVNRIQDLTSQGVFSGGDFSSLANEVLKPKVGGNKVSIANGWGDRRAMFYMTITERDTDITESVRFKYVFVGFTDNFDVSKQSQHLPNDMRLTFNHVFTFSETNTTQGFGGSRKTTNLISSHQIFSRNYSAQENSFKHDNSVYGVRPGDVFATIQTSGILEGLDSSTSLSPIDNRRVLSSGNSNKIAFSDRMINNNASTYLEKTIKAINNGAEETANDAYPNPSEAVSKMYGFAADRDADISGGVNSPGMNFLNDVQKEMCYHTKGYLAFRELVNYFGSRVDELLNKPGSVSTIPAASSNSVKALLGSMQGFGSKTKQTEIALILGHAVPTYMMRCGIQEYGFFATNDVIGGLLSTSGFVIKPLANNDALGSNSVRMFSNDLDVKRQLTIFHDIIQAELLRSVSRQGGYKLTVEMSVSLCGDSRIRIRWGSDPAEDFVIPTFCDALFGNMATDDQSSLHDMAYDINQYADNSAGLFGHPNNFNADAEQLLQGIDSDFKSSFLNNTNTDTGAFGHAKEKEFSLY